MSTRYSSCRQFIIVSFSKCLFVSQKLVTLIGRYILMEGSYELDIYAAAEKALGKGGFFLDIGANFGYFFIMVSKLPGVHVISFEPSERELSRLNYNIAINKSNNITVFPFCLGNEDAGMQLHLTDNTNPGMNSLVNQFPGTQTQQVLCFKLSSILTTEIIKRVKFIKIDVEGFEYNVLEGMGNLLDVFDGTIVLEITYFFEATLPGYNPDHIYDLLEQKGFTAKYGRRYAKQYNDFFIRA